VTRLARWAVPLAAVALVMAYASGRRPGAEPFTETRFLMDTLVTVTVWGTPEPDARAAEERAFAALAAVDQEMARVEGTPLWELNRAGGGRVSEALASVLADALAWARRTGGAFDPTVAPLLDLWDIPRGPHPPPSPLAVDAALSQVGWDRVRLDPGRRTVDLGRTRVDLGGIAKGWAIDRAAEALRAAGASDFIVNAGGDLYVAGRRGDRPWRVGIQHPRNQNRFLRVVAPMEGALVTSGDYERFYEWEGRRFHHILDPRTGRPARGCQSVTVWAPTAVDADALSTAVFVLGPEEGLRLLEAQPGVEGLVVAADGTVRETPGFARVAPEVRW